MQTSVFFKVTGRGAAEARRGGAAETKEKEGGGSEGGDIGSTGGRGLYGMFPKDNRPPTSVLNVDNTRTADEQGLLQKMLRLDPKQRISTMVAVQDSKYFFPGLPPRRINSATS